jgi:hypothetical protein
MLVTQRRQRLVLGSPGTSVRLSFPRHSTSQQKVEQYSIDLVRAAVSANNDLDTLRNLLAEAQQEIRRLRQDKQSLVEQTCLLARAQRTIGLAELDALKLEVQQLKQTCEEQKALLVRAKQTCMYICFFAQLKSFNGQTLNYRQTLPGASIKTCNGARSGGTFRVFERARRRCLRSRAGAQGTICIVHMKATSHQTRKRTPNHSNSRIHSRRRRNRQR